MAVLLPVCYLGMAQGDRHHRHYALCAGDAFLGNAATRPILIFLNERFSDRDTCQRYPDYPGISVLRWAA